MFGNKTKKLKATVTLIKAAGLQTTIKTKSYVVGIMIVSFFLFIFFSCMLAFIDHAKSCFTTNGSTQISKVDYDFTISGDVVSTLGLISGIVLFILCGFILMNFDEFQKILLAPVSR